MCRKYNEKMYAFWFNRLVKLELIVALLTTFLKLVNKFVNKFIKNVVIVFGN